MATRAQFVSEVRTWKGTRWLHLGRMKGVGVDCVGLVYESGRLLKLTRDIELPVYPRMSYDNQLVAFCNQYLVRANGPALGRIALMRFDKETRHMGVIADYPNGFALIHAYAVARKVVEHRLDSLWSSRIFSYFDFPDYEDA